MDHWPDPVELFKTDKNLHPPSAPMPPGGGLQPSGLALAWHGRRRTSFIATTTQPPLRFCTRLFLCQFPMCLGSKWVRFKGGGLQPHCLAHPAFDPLVCVGATWEDTANTKKKCQKLETFLPEREGSFPLFRETEN